MDSWNEIVYLVLAVVPVGWIQALNVCQWAHDHMAERVSGNCAHGLCGQFRGSVVAGKCCPGLSRSSFWCAGQSPPTCSPCHLLGGATSGLEFGPVRLVVGVSRRGFGAFVLQCFTSHLLVGQARTKSVLWCSSLHVSGSGAERAPGHSKCGLRLLSTRDRQRQRLWVPVIRELRVAASLIFWLTVTCRRRVDASPWGGALVAASIPAAAPFSG